MRRILLAAVTLAALGTPASAQDPGCSGFKWSVAREMTAFQAGGLPSVAPGDTLPALSAAVTLRLVPLSEVTYAVPPKHKPKHVPSFGGSFVLPAVPAADTYQVTLSDDAWIDVVQSGKLLKQDGFTAAHNCKAVHKSLRFSLGAGSATIEISDASTDRVTLEVLPKER